MSYEAIIGLEVHVELSSKTKLFCSCKNEFGGTPNSRICPICTGQPGTLPHTNKNAVFLALRAAKSLGCTINRSSKQCRKHYFYPDLPKGYQISQRELPLGVSGEFSFPCDGEIKNIRIHQVQLEEDAGKLIHNTSGKTLVDYNRAGVPLIEIVTEPDIRSAGEARAFLEALRHTLIRAGISTCRMEEGAMRCDVNVSLRKKGETKLNNRVEMKNVNTFSGAERAIVFEISRQEEIMRAGAEVFAETRRWDDEKKASFVMRTKESVPDYKFMPEPDIPSYIIEDTVIADAARELPETDADKMIKFEGMKVAKDDIKRLLSDVSLCDFFEETVTAGADAPLSAKLIVGDVTAYLARESVSIKETKLESSDLAYIVGLIKEKKLTNLSAKKIAEALMRDGGDVKKLSEKHICITGEDIILQTVQGVLSENKKALEDYLGGKAESLTYLMGQCMRRLSGRADADLLRATIIKEIKKRKGKR